MTYLFIGDNTHDKITQIAQIKAKWTAEPDALQFDHQVLYGHKLDPKDLKKALLALPAILKERLVYIHEAEKLDEHCKTILLEFVSAKPSYLVLILDCAALSDKDEIWKEVRGLSKVHETRKGVKENAFDMSKKIVAGQSAEALQDLYQLYEAGSPPLYIIPAIVWTWGNNRKWIPLDKFEQGLNVLQEADLNIKRSRMDSEQALEVAVVKLAELRKQK